jgi:hypothetical protein
VCFMGFLEYFPTSEDDLLLAGSRPRLILLLFTDCDVPVLISIFIYRTSIADNHEVKTRMEEGRCIMIWAAGD